MAVDASGFQLYGTSNLVPPVVWTPETVSLQTNSQTISTTIPLGRVPDSIVWPGRELMMLPELDSSSNETRAAVNEPRWDFACLAVLLQTFHESSTRRAA